MITVRYIYSACIEIKTSTFSILCDPWFTEGAYDGSWYQFPRISNPWDVVSEVDYIYISHIHPDHYDPEFLRQYLAKFPRTKVIIADFSNNFLAKKMTTDKVPHRIINEKVFADGSSFRIFPNEMGSLSDVDSILVVKFGSNSVVNANDNFYNENVLNQVLEFCNNTIDIALLPYTGAGPYPQTYYSDEINLSLKSEIKKQDFFERYKKIKNKLNPKVSIPFAGKYLLGGSKSHLNSYRGVADPVEVLSFDPSAIVLNDGGHASINTSTLKATSARTEKYNSEDISRRITEISLKPMAYEVDFSIPLSRIPWQRLLPKAYKNAIKFSESTEDYFFCLKIDDDNFFVMNTNKNNPSNKFLSNIESLTPRSEVNIDYRYLFGLVTLIYHWNNAEIGSQFYVSRVPDVFRRDAQRFLNFFHV